MTQQRRTRKRERLPALEAELAPLEVPGAGRKRPQLPGARWRAGHWLTAAGGALAGVAGAMAGEHFGKPEAQVLGLMVVVCVVFGGALVLFRRREDVPPRKFMVFVMLLLFGGAIAAAILFVGKLSRPIAIHDLHAVTDAAYARWDVRGRGEPNARVEVALELETGLLKVQEGDVAADGSFQIEAFGGDGYWVHPDMAIAVRQVFPNDPSAEPQPWIRYLPLPATPEPFVKERSGRSAAQAITRLQIVTWNAPQARCCTR